MPERIPELRVLGELELARDGAAETLPRSRKTRALLAYLAVTARPQRRERLCEIFWQVPDDPRGALRWSLSKLRPLLGDRLQADREAVVLDGMPVDWPSLKAALGTPMEETPLEHLRDAAARFRGDFLEGLALTSCPIFEAWRVALSEEARQLYSTLLAALCTRLESEPEQALAYAREGLRRAQLSCPEYAIERCGSFNFRHIQHNPAKPLSTHAFGATIDQTAHLFGVGLDQLIESDIAESGVVHIGRQRQRAAVVGRHRQHLRA